MGILFGNREIIFGLHIEPIFMIELVTTLRIFKFEVMSSYIIPIKLTRAVFLLVNFHTSY